MKTSDLTVGDHYLMSQSNDWESYSQSASRVVVLDSVLWGYWAQYGQNYRSKRTLHEGTAVGTVAIADGWVADPGKHNYDRGVLVTSVDKETGVPNRHDENGIPIAFVTPPKNIRAPWADGLARIAEAARQHKIASDKVAAARKARFDEDTSIQKALLDLGFDRKDVLRTSRSGSSDAFFVPIPMLRALIDQAQPSPVVRDA